MPLWLRLLTIITFCSALAGLLGPLNGPGGSLALMSSPESLPGIVFFVAALIICVLTWRRTPGGAFLMLLLQLLQVVSISGNSGRTFIARCGPVLEVVLAPGGYRLVGGLQALFADTSSSGGMSLVVSYSTLQASLLEIATHVVGFNLLPLFLAVMIWIHLGQPVASAQPVAASRG